MKRVIAIFVGLFAVCAAWAESLDIRSLHHLSNTMEHKDFLMMAIKYDSLTRSITTAQWHNELNLISSDTLSTRLLPTLYDLIADDYCSRYRSNHDSVLSAWLAFHEHDESLLPRLYIMLKNWKYNSVNECTQLYASLPTSWERGYILTRPDFYRNHRTYYHYLCEYLLQFPNSPFVPDLLHRKHICEQIELDFSFPPLLSTTDSITITYSNTNAHEIIFELYRLPDKMPKKGSLAGLLVKVDSLRVLTDQPFIFRHNEQQCKLAPQTFGNYFIYARLPEDSMQVPVDSLIAPFVIDRTFCVSNLRCFMLQEGQMNTSKPWIIVTDVHTGKPVQHVRVKPDFAFTRYTNQDGEAKTPRWFSYYRKYKLISGDDKYNQTLLVNSAKYTKRDQKLTILPNATVFRPGDTLHLAIIGQQRRKFISSLLREKRVEVSIYNPQWQKTDTIVMLDEYGKATIDIPCTDEMRRGSYSIHACYSNAYANVYFQLEDYRLPTFSVAFDDSCRTIKRGKLSPVTGKALRTNGLPMEGAQVTATFTLSSYPYYVPPQQLDTITTNLDGSFRFHLPNCLIDSLNVHKFLYINASATSTEGEIQTASIRISLESDQPSSDTIPMICGVPQDSLLWLPADSISVQGRNLTLRLGVPQESWVYCVTSSRNRILSHSWQLLEAGMHTYSFLLPEKTDDYLDVRFITTLPDGSFTECHHHQQGINETELHIIPVTMRDYLTPDANETWTLRLTDQQGNAVQGRMIITMTDQALESLSSSLWRERLMPIWQHPFTACYIPDISHVSANVTSHIPLMQQGWCDRPPYLYEPYRTDSTRLMVIYGQVVDTQGEPIIGASILEQGTERGAISDYNGYFSLAVSPDAIIECTYIGMKRVSCQPYSNMYIVLEESDQILQEIVTTGYGIVNDIRRRGGFTSNQKTISYGISAFAFEEEDFEEEIELSSDHSADLPDEPNAAPVLRQGDTRLAFYLPDLQTDTAGEIHIRFLTPPDNTEWIMQAVAWNKDGASDYMTRNLMARRTLMLRLQMPRFMRQGDRLSLPCIISNTADTTRHTQVILQIRDAVTDSLLATFTEDLSVAPSASKTLFFPYTASFAHDIIVRAEVRDADGTSDGEQRRLTVLPIVEPVSECLPFYMHASDSVLTLSLPAAKDAANRHVTLMCCSDPLAYMLTQLPQSVDSSAVTVNEIAHNLYALSLRNRLVHDYPSVAPVDVTWLETKLRAHQRLSGGFAWLESDWSAPSWYLTLRMLALIGELQEADAMTNQVKFMKRFAIKYIDREAVRQESEYRKSHHDSLPGYTDFALYACVRAMFSEDFTDDSKRIYTAALDSLYAHISSSELTIWPLLALAFERAGQHDRALTLINGLRRYATIDHDHGMYWNNLPDRWWWYRQVDLQASFLLAFSRIDPQPQELEALRQWIILNNRTSDWGTSSLNAYVTYVLMQGMPVADQTQDSTGIQYITLPDTTTSYTLRNPHGTLTWGALMTSYDAPVDQLQAFSTKALKIERRFERCDSSPAINAPLAKGDRIRVILTITTDREMDYVILTDRRAALLEPVGVSSYEWKDNAFYYRDIRNTEERFYIEHLSRGKTILSYECYVTASGATLASLAAIVSEIAPEFVAHTTTDLLKTKK